MLIRGATRGDGSPVDVRLAGGRIAAIGAVLAQPGEPVVEAHGGLLLPGLHDHHIHVAATAAAFASVRCGPPEVADETGLAAALARPGTGWLRGIGYHESVAGVLDRALLDRLVPGRPARIQHRSGRMWFLNSAALDLLLADRAAPPGLDTATGQLFDSDAWLKATLGSHPPDFAEIGAALARAGVTGLTEISPANDGVMAAHFSAQQACGALPQSVLLAGSLALEPAHAAPTLAIGPAKLHLHEAALPALGETVAFIRAAHGQGRVVAVHCATEVELLFTLAALDEAGSQPGDRIEHASVTPDFAVERIAEMGLAVVSQPHFVTERGDAYLRDVEPETQPLLYRLRAFADAGVPLAAGSDAPFGQPAPWASMAAAVSRRTAAGATIGETEALSPDQALDLYLRDPQDISRTRTLDVGAPADLCLLDRDWAAARDDLASVAVHATIIAGQIVHQRVDQPPP